MPETKEMPMIESTEELEKLHVSLMGLIDNLNDQEHVPERYGSSIPATLADQDYHILSLAGQIVHRLMLGAKYRNGTVSSYVEYHAPIQNEEGEEANAEG